MIIQTPNCTVCGGPSMVELDEGETARWPRTWRSGLGTEHIQNVYPEWTADQRELVISGTHKKCWEMVFHAPTGASDLLWGEDEEDE